MRKQRKVMRKIKIHADDLNRQKRSKSPHFWENYADAYAYACVVRFNTAPYTVPKRGCAIFFHCGTRPTDGCVALPEENLVRVLLWMEPEKHPFILITGSPKDG